MRNYILEKLGSELGSRVNADIEAGRKELDSLCEGESKENAKTMRSEILPRIAMYRALQKVVPADKAYEVVWDYTKTRLCNGKRFAHISRIPFFFAIFKGIFKRTMTEEEQWTAEVTADSKSEFSVCVRKCLWHDTCVKCDCEELCKVFCDSDWENFGSLRKVKFARTQTLGTGGSECDFKFSREV